MRSKRIITGILITTSVVLLLILQGFWLRSVYKDEVSNLRRETHAIFRNVLFDMNDSLLQKSIKPLHGDSGRSRRYFIRRRDSLHFIDKSPPDGAINDSLANVQVFISSDTGGDSINQFLKPLVSRLRERRGRRFSIQLRKDSLKTKDIEKNFDKALAAAGIYLPLHIKRIKREPKPGPRPPRLNDQSSIFTPTGGYHIDYPDLRLFLFRKMAPQIAFSVLLTVLTISTFLVMIRNLRSQQKLMDLKNDFISNVTHELKTPVATVSVAIEALQNFKGIDNPQLTKEYLDIAQSELDRLSILTDKILKTALFENKGIDYVAERVQLDMIVEQAISALKPLAEKQGASIGLDKSGSDFAIKGSEVHLTHVINNLLDNALKYSAPKAAIRVTLVSKDETVTLSVQDNGIGIADQFKKKIFEKFFRVPTGDVHNVKGYGLGLSYVENVVKSHGGTIEVKSELGKGSLFIIKLKRSLS